MKISRKSAVCIFLILALALSLCGCGSSGNQGTTISGENITIDDLALREDGSASHIVENEGMKLLIPLEYEPLLTVKTPTNDPDGVLFSVYETASIEADRAQGSTVEGAGWLFDIARVSEDDAHAMLCEDMSGRELFARDAGGCYYVHLHPTDVRFVRESYDDVDAELAVWSMLNEWAAGVDAVFISENEGLSAKTHGNSFPEILLYRIAYRADTSYTVCVPGSEPLPPEATDPLPFVEKLTAGVAVDYADIPAPDGEYAVIAFPDEGCRLDFFRAEGEGNTIRLAWSDGSQQLYRAAYADGATQAAALVQEWYDALAAAQGAA